MGLHSALKIDFFFFILLEKVDNDEIVHSSLFYQNRVNTKQVSGKWFANLFWTEQFALQ